MSTTVLRLGLVLPKKPSTTGRGSEARLSQQSIRNARWDAVVLYILLIAASNIGLGFGVAAYLGWRYRRAIPSGDPWCGAAPGRPIDGALGGRQGPAVAAEVLPADRPRQQSANAATDQTTDGSCQSTSDRESGREVAAEASAGPRGEESPCEKAVDALSAELQRYGEQVAEADKGLRANAEDPEAAAIRAVLGSLKGSTQQYLEAREVQGGLENLDQQQPEIGRGLQAAIEQQDRQIERTSAMIEEFDYDSELEEGCRRMVAQTGKLIDSNGHLLGVLDETKVRLSEERQREQGQGGPEGESPAAGPGQAALEAELLRWFSGQAGPTPRLSAGVVELDLSAEFESRHGEELAERVFLTVGRLLEEEGGDDLSLVPLPERRFLLVFPEVDTALAAGTVERMRQTVERARLLHEGAELRVTVSGAVVGTASGEGPGVLAERVEAALQEARRYGCNRTFLHDGKYPTPVAPPNFALEEKRLTVCARRPSDDSPLEISDTLQ